MPKKAKAKPKANNKKEAKAPVADVKGKRKQNETRSKSPAPTKKQKIADKKEKKVEVQNDAKAKTTRSNSKKPDNNKKEAKASQKDKKATAKTKAKSPSPEPAKNSNSNKANKITKKNDVSAKTANNKQNTRGAKKKEEPKKEEPKKEEPKKEEPKKEEPKKEEDSKIVKVTKKCGAVVDSHCPIASTVHVFSSSEKTYDQTLNQSNLTFNNNKFYILQVLQKDNDANSFYFWTRWGRVGVPGQNALAGPIGKEKAIDLFEKKLHDKTCKGEYTKIEIAYDEEEEAKPVVIEKKSSKQLKISGKVSLPRTLSILDKRLANLINLIFDMKMMNTQMKEIGYDAKKMPLGKLAKSTIQQGYVVLKDLSEALEKKTARSVLESLSSKFYSLIPHDFGFQKMSNFILDDKEKVKTKLDMLQSLSDMQVATKLLDQGTSPEENLIDANYRKLECRLKPVDTTSKEYKLIEQYIADSKGSWKIQLMDVFEVDRKGEFERFKSDIGNRILLWHGSGIGNFVGILSQGLRIAPPEAPVSGYRFGKGIYFADMIEKSAGYCRAYNSEACALLGDVACGNFSLKYGSDCNANNLPKGTHCTLGVGNIGPPKESWGKLDKDVQLPLGKPKPISGGGWGHNEYIVYDVAQVKLRYLIRMKLG